MSHLMKKANNNMNIGYKYFIEVSMFYFCYFRGTKTKNLSSLRVAFSVITDCKIILELSKITKS